MTRKRTTRSFKPVKNNGRKNQETVRGRARNHRDHSWEDRDDFDDAIDWGDDEQRSQFDFSSHYRFGPRNHKQELALSILKKVDYLFLIGSAGSGKSCLATALAVREIAFGRADNMVITRPIVESGESLGYLPGGLDEKVAPYMVPINDQLHEIFDNKTARKTFSKERVRVAPLAYMRGRTFKNSICVFDEAQNATYTQLKMYLTRLGEGSKMIITGDPEQIDIDKISRNQSGLMDVINRCSHRPSVGVVKFTDEDNVRHPSVGWMLQDL